LLQINDGFDKKEHYSLKLVFALTDLCHSIVHALLLPYFTCHAFIAFSFTILSRKYIVYKISIFI